MADEDIERDIHNVLATFADAYHKVKREVETCDDRDEAGDVAKETLAKLAGICARPCGEHFACTLIHEMWYGVDWGAVADDVADKNHWDNNDDDEDDDDDGEERGRVDSDYYRGDA